MELTTAQLINKYNVPGPRYTSYPTVPYWDAERFSLSGWKQSLQKSFRESGTRNGISLYIHLPFCESMCTFCGCTKRITKNHLVELPYIHALIKELNLYRKVLGQKPTIQQLHLGGGTPTFFSPENLEILLTGIFRQADLAPGAEMSFEGHPNNTTRDHLRTFSRFGFKRVCYGVQDYNRTVQQAINRVQPYENVERVTSLARELGYDSVGHDIIFGLPFQTADDVRETIKKTITLAPDRIAFYSYAHVPWIKGNGQRGYQDTDLPSADEKRKQYEIGKQMLHVAGYREIGMDHFALPTDALAKAQDSGNLHRNFMGYTISDTPVMIGLGVSAIGDSWYGFAQNVKSLEEYHHLIKNDILPIMRGHLLTEEDQVVRRHILNLMCHFKTTWKYEALRLPEIPEILTQLKPLEEDGLLQYDQNGIRVTERGRPFIRNICLPFDLRLQRKKPDRQLFSMTV